MNSGNAEGTDKKKIVILASVAAVILIIAIVTICIVVTKNSGAKSSGAVTEAVSEDTLRESVTAIVKPYYDKMPAVSLMGNGMGRYFTDHKFGHADMVADKSIEAGEAINEALDKGGLGKNAGEGRVVFGKTTGKTLMVAGLCHDMGMCGEGYSLTEILGDDGKALRDENGNKMYEKTDAGLYKMHQIELDNFPEIRTSHSMNSALIVLMNRKAFNEAGLTDEEIDKISLECFAHSKSNSGVTDLNSVSSWTECFDRMDSLVAAYNADHTDAPISFDRTPFEKDPAKLSTLAAETLALRVGDVSRDSAPEAEAHSGEAVYVERDTINDRGGSIPDEVEGMTMTIGPNHDPVDGEKDRQVHSGEQNITDNHTIVNEDGILTHIITVNDGCSAPKCTQQAIDDHLGEFYSARDEEFIVKVEFTHFNDDEDGFFHDSYEEFRMQASQDYPSVTLLYPWD